MNTWLFNFLALLFFSVDVELALTLQVHVGVVDVGTDLLCNNYGSWFLIAASQLILLKW